MRRLLIPLLLLLACAGCERHAANGPTTAGITLDVYRARGTAPRFGRAEAPSPQAASIRLATYNVQDLFDDNPPGEPKPQAQLRAVARAIHRLDADILALQEVESREALIAFRDEYLADMGYDHVCSIDAGGYRGIEQSVLSRFPIVRARNWPHLGLGAPGRDDEELAFARSPLRVDVQIPAPSGDGAPYAITLFVVHQKAGRDSVRRRRLEAEHTVQLARAPLRAGRNVVILGDFNAVYKAPAMDVYIDARFVDPMGQRAGSKWISHESGRRIDAILLSPAAAHELIPDSAFILGTPARPAGADWRTTPPPPGYASDHYPLAIDLIPRDSPPR